MGDPHNQVSERPPLRRAEAYSSSVESKWRMPQLPTGTVTFLLTDVEGSSQLWEKYPHAMPQAIRRHHEIIHRTIESHSGKRPSDQGEGDSVAAAFSRATDAVASAVEIQRALHSEQWPDDLKLRVRIAIHTGEAELRDQQNYATPVLNRAARLRSIAHGGQTLISQSTWDLVRERPPSAVSFRDLGEHRLKDLTQPERVFQLIHSELPDDFPPLRSLEQLPNNLPLQLTRFIGREREFNEVKTLLASSRLVTLTGAGGCGKTRLALQVAADLLDEYRDGVWFVDLSPLAEPEAVPRTVAAVLRIEEQPGQSVEEALQEGLRTRESLILLDNCEHVLTECAELAARLLRSSPSLRILATSREALAVPGEIPWRVPSLSIPDPNSPPSPNELRGFEAAELFLDRAGTIVRDLEVSENDSSAIAQILHRLDGIPLAIELAAARAEVLTFPQIASKLDDQFRLLTGGSRTSLERQQTMRAAVEWSYKLLTDDERTLLRRLSVFAGGFSLEAAEEICGIDPLTPTRVLDLVAALVQKSLVSAARKGRAARYRLLEAIRQFAREKLAETEEGVEVRTRHRDWFRNVAEQAEEPLLGPEQAQWGERLEEELDNLRSALEWSIGLSQFHEVLRIAAPMWRFWMLRHPIEGISWLEAGLASESDETSVELRARALAGLSFLLSQIGDPVEARRRAEEGVKIARQSGIPIRLARSLNMLGNILMEAGDHTGGKVLYEEALGILEELGDRRGAAVLSANLGQIAARNGELSEAQSRLEDALKTTRDVGDTFNAGMALLMLGDIKTIRCDFAGARACVEESLSMWRGLDALAAFMPTATLSILDSLLGDYEGARAWCREGISIVKSRSEPMARIFLVHGEGWLAYLDGAYQLARAKFEESYQKAREMGHAEAAIDPLLFAAFSVEGHRDFSTARRYCEEFIAQKRALQRPIETRLALATVGRVAGEEGDVETAAGSLTEALRICLKVGDSAGGAEAFGALGALSIQSTELEKAARLFGTADALRQSVGAKPWPHLRNWLEEKIGLVRAELTGDAFDAAWSEGKSENLKRAAARVLEGTVVPGS
jgi:predicted ATPase/class 3 adenylate cyclase